MRLSHPTASDGLAIGFSGCSALAHSPATPSIRTPRRGLPHPPEALPHGRRISWGFSPESLLRVVEIPEISAPATPGLSVHS
jgi:hypothetical protein